MAGLSLGLGLGLGPSGVAGELPAPGEGELDESLTPPVLSLAVGAEDYPPEFTAAFDDTMAVGYTIVLQWTTDIRFGSITGEAENNIDGSEAAAEEATFDGLNDVETGSHYFRCYIVKPNGDYSAMSNVVLHGEAEDSTPAAFSFTDDPLVERDTVCESDEITLSGFNLPVAISVTGGEYAIDAGSGYGSWTSAVGTAYPGDKVKLRHTSSADYSTSMNTALTAGGISDTFTTTTEAEPVPDLNPPAGSVLLLEAKELSTLFQSNAGATAVASDGDPVGYWGDQSGGGFHMTAAGNDTTRPTYKLVGGKPFIRFDGSNDFLRRAASLGSYAAGAATFGFAVIANPAVNCTLFGIGSSAGNNPTYYLMSNNGTANRGSAQIRNDTGTTTFAPSNNLGSNAFNNTARRLIFVDNGSSITLYIDGVAQTPVSYTRAGALTLNLTGMGAWVRATPTLFFAADVAGVVAYNSALGGGDLTDLDDYLASLL